MRICGACREPVRWDETLQTQWLEAKGDRRAGFCSACPRCCAEGEGTEPLPPVTYPEGRVPRHPLADDLLPICGLCREALFESERTTAVRLAEEDVSDEGVKPGAYAMCPRCYRRWYDAVRGRWLRERVIAEGAHVDQLL